jgi:hypothetical protein
MISGSTDTVSVTISHAAPNADPLLDLVFVIDNSGSMKKNDPQFLTPQLVSTFVHQLPADSKIGMVLFDIDARLLTPLAAISHSRARQTVIDSLKTIDYRGQFTNTPAGIERALYELKTKGRPEAQKGIIFITDGIVDTGDKRKDQKLAQWLKKEIAEESKQMNTRIFGIALTEAADFSLIQALALKTNGEYFRTFHPSEISGVLEKIQELMTPPREAPQPAPEPIAQLAPLPLLPVPEDTPETKPVEPAQAKAQIVPPPPTPLPDERKSLMGVGKQMWVAAVAIALLLVAIIGLLFFIFIHFNRQKHTPTKAVATKTPNMPEAHIEVMDGDLKMENMPFKIDQEIIKIGRSQRNDLVIGDPAVSGFHATIEFRHMYFYLEDQQSTNGTMLNDQRISPNESVRLKNGDCITIAKYKLNFTITNQIPFGDTIMLSMTALEDPEAEATVVLDLEGADSKQGLISCIQNHLIQIYGLSPEHKEYVNTYFAAETIDIIATTAHKNLQQSTTDKRQYCTPIIKNNAFYVICSLPTPISNAARWYGQQHNGFTQFIFKWIRSQPYESAQCEQLCIVTFGQDPATWVSITIVPTHSNPDPVEIMSVDFLNEEEKSSLALDYDNHGRII